MPMFVPSLSWQNDHFCIKKRTKGTVFLPEWEAEAGSDIQIVDHLAQVVLAERALHQLRHHVKTGVLEVAAEEEHDVWML